MKIATRLGLNVVCLAILVSQAFGQATYTTPEAQKAAAQTKARSLKSFTGNAADAK